MPLVFCPLCGEVDSDDPTLDADQIGDIPCFTCSYSESDYPTERTNP